MTLFNITTGFIVSIMFSSLTTVYAANEDTEKIKQLPGISIVGNKEAPQPLDRDSFRLQLQLYKLSNTNRYKLTP